MKKSETKILLIGIGNSGRGDDGLGWAFLDQIKDWVPENIDMVYHYQLQVEDAELLKYYDRVYFIDAFMGELPEGYKIESCHPKAEESFTSHEMSPQGILHLAKTIYGIEPESYLVTISGEYFELKEGLSEFAENNLMQAVNYFKDDSKSRPKISNKT